MDNADRKPGRPIARRDLLTLGLGAFVVATLPRASRGREPLVRRTLPVMGTLAELAVVHRDPAAAHAAIDAAMDELRRVEDLMTRFSPTSEVGRANRLAADRPVEIGPATATVMRAALGWAQASDGEFDPCLGRAIRIWDVGRRRVPPETAAVRALAGRHLYQAVEVGAWRGAEVIRFRSAEVEVDLGGIAKGYGVDRAVEALRRHGVDQGIVNVGGDLYALGASPAGGGWRVGIRAPAQSQALAAEIVVSDAAVATSGDYLQYFSHAGRRYHHLLDPATGAPRITPVRSVTIQADTCLTADAAATTVFGMAPARAARLLQAHAADARVVSALGGAA